MSLDLATLAAILAMAAATLATRLGGYALMKFVTPGAATKRLLDAIPPAVMAAVVAPTALATGWAETLACAVTALAAFRLPMLPAAALGVATVAALRYLGL